MLWMRGDLALATHMVAVNHEAIHRDSAVHAEAKRRGLATMKKYVSTRSCRRRVLLEYLGDRLEQCSGCDRCG
jgi:superfamily II DNA helicase RecQ